MNERWRRRTAARWGTRGRRGSIRVPMDLVVRSTPLVLIHSAAALKACIYPRKRRGSS